MLQQSGHFNRLESTPESAMVRTIAIPGLLSLALAFANTEPNAQPASSNIDPPRLITGNPGAWRLPGSVPDAQGGFADCGPVRTMLRAPSPTQALHSLNATTNGASTCVMNGSFRHPWEFPDLPNVDFVGQDKLIFLNTDILGDLRINGTRIQVNLVGGHVVRGRVCMVRGSSHISFNGRVPALCN